MDPVNLSAFDAEDALIQMAAKGSLEAFNQMIVTRTADGHLHRSKRHRMNPPVPAGEEIEPPDRTLDPSASLEAAIEQKGHLKRIPQLLGELPKIHRSALTLVDIYSPEYCEVAEILNIPPDVVKSRLAQARLQMRLKLQADSKARAFISDKHVVHVW